MARKPEKLYYKIIKGKYHCIKKDKRYEPGQLNEQGMPEAIECTGKLDELFPGQFERYDFVAEERYAKAANRYIPTPEELEAEEEEVDELAQFGKLDYSERFDCPEGFAVRGSGNGHYKVVRVDEKRVLHDKKVIQEDAVVKLIADLKAVIDNEESQED